MKKGLFITLEGPDGSGKTTIATIIKERLILQGYEVSHSREPGGVKIAEEIRNIILNPKNVEMDTRTEALLYAASRRQHLVEKIIPAIDGGKIVLCERFLDSSLAYQGYGREIGFEEVLSINRFAIGNYMPDLTIYLDLDEAVGLKRISSRSFKDRLDLETLAFHTRVKKGYQAIIAKFPERIKVISASEPVEVVADKAYDLIIGFINEKYGI